MSLSALATGIQGALASYAGFVNAAINGNTGADATSGVIRPETFYNTQLLETIRDAAETYQYFRYATPMMIDGKAEYLTMRRWAPLQAHTVPLEEGVPPISDKGSVEVYKIGPVKGYGRYMEFTDEVDWKVVDPVIAHYTNEYSIVAVETLDLLAQDMLMTCAQKWFAGASTATSMADLATLNISALGPKMSDFRLMNLAFKKAKVKPYDTTYHVLCSPEFIFDMMADAYVTNLVKITQNAAVLYEDQALPNMFGFSFHEVQNCPTSAAFYDATAAKWKCLQITSAGVISVVSTDAVVSSGYVKDSRTGKDASYIPNMRKFTADANNTILKVNHIIVLGKDALVRTGMTGEDNAQMYVKPLGSAGVLDPLDQRQSIGFRIKNVGFGCVNLDAVVDYICVPTQVNI